MDPPFHFYKLLEVPRDCHELDIKKSYRRLALKYHPDKNTDEKAAPTFQAIHHAYEVLVDPDRRREYHMNRGVDRIEVMKGVKNFDAQLCIRMFQGGFEKGSIILFASVLSAAAIPASQAFGFWVVVASAAAADAAPRSREDARKLNSWFESLGIILSPLVVIGGVAVVLGSELFKGGQATLQYAHSRVNPLLEAGKSTLQYSQAKLCDVSRAAGKLYSAYVRPSSSPLSMDDFTLLGASGPQTRNLRKQASDHRSSLPNNASNQQKPLPTGHRRAPRVSGVQPVPPKKTDSMEDDWCLL